MYSQDTMGTALPLLEKHWCKGQPSTGRLVPERVGFVMGIRMMHYMLLSQVEEKIGLCFLLKELAG
jgi:hypothetical protein